jgi:hypothetical protein
MQPCLPLPCPGGFPVASICAWCKKDMPVKAVDKLPYQVSHGMCPECFADFHQECQNPNCDQIISTVPTEETCRTCGHSILTGEDLE